MLKKSLICAGLIFGTSATSIAADTTGQFAVDGAGSQQCSAYINAWEENNRDLYVFIGWLDGYISSQNQATENTFDLTPWQTSETVASLVFKACKNKPEDSFLLATIKVLRFLAPTKQPSQSELVKVTVNEQSLYLYQHTINQIHEKLVEFDYLDKKSAQNFDEDMIAALRKFQSTNKLKASGFPDQKTLIILLLGQAVQ